MIYKDRALAISKYKITQNSQTETTNVVWGRLKSAYVFQQADLIRLETQCKAQGTTSAEEFKELSQQQKMISAFQALLDTYSRVHNQDH